MIDIATLWDIRQAVRAKQPLVYNITNNVVTNFTANVLLAPRLGAAALVGFVVTGQLLFAVLADQFGWLGFAQHSASVWRYLGCVLMMAGVALIARF